MWPAFKFRRGNIANVTDFFETKMARKRYVAHANALCQQPKQHEKCHMFYIYELDKTANFAVLAHS